MSGTARRATRSSGASRQGISGRLLGGGRRSGGRGRGVGRPGDEAAQRQRVALEADDWVLPPGLRGADGPRWTLVGTVDAPEVATVDPCGLVTTWSGAGGWSLDWWVGADDRWHLPARDTGVRQRLVGDAPVVETALRIPGGDAIQRVYGMRGASFPGGDEYLVVEVENRSSVPFALAWAIRPLTPERTTTVHRIALEPVAGGTGRDTAHGVSVDDRAALVFTRRPARVAGGSRAEGDAAVAVLAGEAPLPPTDGGRWEVACADGSATAAFIFPVPHTATVRCLVPLGADRSHRVGYPAAVPTADQVAAGWAAHAERGMRVDLPDPKLDGLTASAHRSLLLAPWSHGLRHAGPRLGRDERDGGLGDAARITAALDRWGHPDQAARTLVEWTRGLDDLLGSSVDGGELAAVVDAVATHRVLGGEPGLFEDLLPDVVACVERLRRSAPRLAPPARRDAERALRTLAAALDATGQPEAGAAISETAGRIARPAAPAGEPSPDATDAGATAVDARLEAVRGSIARGDGTAGASLADVVASASATGAFAGPHEGQDLATTARFLDLVRDLLVDDGGGELRLLPVVPSGWYGGPVDVHAVPTRHGRLSYAVRWHGERPAVLWELEVWAGSDVPRLRAPGLDADWSTTEPRGEALLARVVPPDGLEPLRVVAEHPDREPAVRPSAERGPDGAPPPSLPDGGTFS